MKEGDQGSRTFAQRSKRDEGASHTELCSSVSSTGTASAKALRQEGPAVLEGRPAQTSRCSLFLWLLPQATKQVWLHKAETHRLSSRGQKSKISVGWASLPPEVPVLGAFLGWWPHALCPPPPSQGTCAQSVSNLPLALSPAVPDRVQGPPAGNPGPSAPPRSFT